MGTDTYYLSFPSSFCPRISVLRTTCTSMPLARLLVLLLGCCCCHIRYHCRRLVHLGFDCRHKLKNGLT